MEEGVDESSLPMLEETDSEDCDQGDQEEEERPGNDVELQLLQPLLENPATTEADEEEAKSKKSYPFPRVGYVLLLALVLALPWIADSAREGRKLLVVVREPTPVDLEKNLEDIYKERRRRLKKTCKAFGLPVGKEIAEGSKGRKRLFDSIVWYPSLNATVCELPKTGTTSRSFFYSRALNMPTMFQARGCGAYEIRADCQEAGDNFIENHEFQFEKLGRLYRIPRHRSSKERRFKESISFVFVRHPFTRLASAYQNKIVDHREPFWMEMGKGKGFWGGPPNCVPSFRQFVSSLLDLGPDFNPHTGSFLKRCHPCSLQYHMVGKVETYHRDWTFFKQLMGAAKKKPTEIHLQTSSGGSSDTLALEYFSQLPDSAVENLYRHYRFDFLALGYDVRNFIKDRPGLDPRDFDL